MSPPSPADRSSSRIVMLSLFAFLSFSDATARAQDQPAASPSSAQPQQSAPAPQAPSTAQPTSQAPANSGASAPATPQAAPAASQPAPGTVETPAVVVEGTTDTILGKPIVSASGDDMGRIVDVMVDHKGMVRAAIIDFGGFLGVGTRKIAVDWRALHFPKSGAMDKIVAELSQDQLRGAPAYKPGEPVVIIGSADVAPQPNPANPATPAVPAATGSAPTQSAPATPAPVPAPATPPPSTPLPSIPAPSVQAPSIPAPSTPAPATPAPTVPAPAQGSAPTQTP